MTDKQIIIDGVDVSKCETIDNDSGWCGFWEEHCSKNPDCIHKKYYRKEQENKDLREDIKDIANLLDLDTGEEYNFGNIELEIKQLKAKEQECEELKATLKVIADRPCLNINDCNGNCLPHCKWNAHKLAQEALKELE